MPVAEPAMRRLNPAHPSAVWMRTMWKTLLLTTLVGTCLATAGAAQQSSAPGALNAATVSFDTVLANSTVVAWLQRHAFRPQAVWTTLGGRYLVPEGESPEQALASVRRMAVRRAEETLCQPTTQQIRRSLERENSRPGGDSIRRAIEAEQHALMLRHALGFVEERRAALAAARSQTPIIWAVAVVGPPESIQMLLRDPRVRGVQRGRISAEGGFEPAVPGDPPRFPPDRYPVRSLRGVEALPLPEVRARLKRITREGLEECRNFTPTPRPEPYAGRPGAPRPYTMDDRFADLARMVPGGFGGLWLTHDTLNVYLKDLSKRAEAQAVLKEQLKGEFGPGAGGGQRGRVDLDRIKFHPGRYDFAELRRWYQQLLQGGIPEFTMSDIDERANRIEIGVREDAMIPRVRKRAAELGIPADALSVRTVAPVRIR